MYIILLFFISMLLAAANYIPGTYLSGWDTLHPEFNLPLAFSRTITGVWRTDQGLGAVAAHSHMAELPRLFMVWLSSLILPIPMIRYGFFFFCLIAGIIGMYFLIADTAKQKTIAFVSALTYLTNLSTVQLFIVPFEMFAVQYAMLPWILLTAKNYLSDGRRQTLFYFSLTIILASPMAYAATLWYAFFLCFVAFVFLFASKKQIRRALFLIGATLLLNLYWMLPNGYFTIYHAKEVQESKVNRLFSPEIFAKNQEFGTIRDVPLLKSFLFDWQLFNTKTNKFEPVMTAWQTHLNNPLVAGFGYVVFGISLFGIICVIRKRNRLGICMLPFFIIPFFLLLNGTYPINQLFEALGQVSPVVKEAIRVPFTKFSILFMVAISFYVAEGIALVKSKSNYIVLAFSLLSLWYFWPAFQGNLIHPAMRVAIPKDYFDMFRWFNSQPVDGRVAILPIHTFWGWTYYQWGYQGAGFLQFGIPQPIMDRDYNRWSKFNEQYQREMSYAIYSQNSKIIANVLAKYNIQWVLLDRSVISPGNTDASLLTWHIPALLTQTGVITDAKNFGSDLTVYRVTPSKPITTTILPEVTAGEQIATFPGRTYQNSNAPVPDSLPFPMLAHDQAYIVSIKSKNVQGFPLELCIINNLTGHCDLFTHLEKNPQFHTEQFVLPPLSDFGTGYTINLNNFAIRGITSINEIGSITVSNITVEQGQSTEPVLVDNHAPEPGWTTVDGKPFFLPQILEWLGFLLIPLPFIFVMFRKK